MCLNGNINVYCFFWDAVVKLSSTVNSVERSLLCFLVPMHFAFPFLISLLLPNCTPDVFVLFS